MINLTNELHKFSEELKQRALPPIHIAAEQNRLSDAYKEQIDIHTEQLADMNSRIDDMEEKMITITELNCLIDDIKTSFETFIESKTPRSEFESLFSRLDQVEQKLADVENKQIKIQVIDTSTVADPKKVPKLNLKQRKS